MYKGLRTLISGVFVERDRTRVVYRGQDLEDLATHSSYVEVTIRHWLGRDPTQAECAVVETIMIAALDHGFLPTLPARMTIGRAPESLQGAIAVGILSQGRRMGNAADAAAKMLQEALADDEPLDTAAARIVETHLARKTHVPGLGNPVHKSYDPRTRSVLQAADDLSVSGRAVTLLQLTRDLLADRLDGLPCVINFSGAVGAVITDLGWPWMLGNAPIILGRVGGVIAHVTEELRNPTDSYWFTELAPRDGDIYEGPR